LTTEPLGLFGKYYDCGLVGPINCWSCRIQNLFTHLGMCRRTCTIKNEIGHTTFLGLAEGGLSLSIYLFK